MRLVTFRNKGEERLGALVRNDAQIVDLQQAFTARGGGSGTALGSMQALIAAGEAGLSQAKSAIDVALRDGTGVLAAAAAQVLAPLPIPPQMRDFLCFEKHLIQAFGQARRVRAAATPDPEAAMREMEAKGVLAVPEIWYQRPIFYKPSRFAVTGPDQDVVWPSYSKIMDYELEFCCVIGTSGRDISCADARKHIFGYTIFNDFSARDEQVIEMPGQLGPGKGKDFDNSNPV